MDFRKYMHIERFGNDAVQGIELGMCYIFPKLDGTNASVWMGNVGIKAGSRNRELTFEDDNAGFYKYVSKNFQYDIFSEHPDWRLYGEWLVPHSIKSYRDDVWRRFYIFDVYSDVQEKYLPYSEYQPVLQKYRLDYIPPLTIINSDATYDKLLIELEKNHFLIKDGEDRCGEGIVIKNYQYKNRFGNTVWAKLVTNQFKDEHLEVMGAPVQDMLEQKICNEYINTGLINKVYAKIINETQGWNNKDIPRLFSEVYYDLVNEELWDILKKHKNPTINFKTLYSILVATIKRLKPELF